MLDDAAERGGNVNSGRHLGFERLEFVYDASYVAIAELTGATLATLDARIGRAPGLRCAVVTP